MILKKNNEEEYIDECKHQKFVSRKHFIHEIEVHHPLSIKYKTYWKEMKRRTMEGYWFEGKWMPGVLYEYVNFSRIRVNKDKYSKTKIVSRPALRDLEWEKAYVFTEARGFSGFADDDVYTCYTPVANYDKLDEYEKADVDERMSPYARKKDGTLKKFVPAREYLRKIHLMNLGKPIYHNEARNVIDIECFAPETLVKLFTGESVRIDSLSVGDLLLGPDSKPRTVKSINKGYGEMYQILSTSGQLGVQHVNGKHIVPVFDTEYGYHELTVLDLLKDHSQKLIYQAPFLECSLMDSFKITPIGLGEFIGVEVDEDNLFLLDNYVVAHNCRGTGKSYTIGNFVKNTYLNDGCYDFDEFVAAEKAGTPFSVEVMVGAIDGKYTKDLLDKIQLSFDYFPGGQTVNGIYYPPPLLKESTGSWYSGKNYIENRYQVKQANGEWETRGTGSKIYNRAFADSEGGNGMRMSLGVIEEVGFFNILEDALASMKDTTKDGTVKFGTIWMAGTGGQMESGKSESAKAVFNDPESYDCLSFNDIWEETGSIGFFVPYEMGLNQFKSDDEGITDMVAATRFADGVRKKLQAGKSKRPLYKEMQNNPRVPSEAFLTQGGNIFPTAELKDHLNWVKSKQDDGFIKGQLGELAYVHVGDKTELQWIPDLKGKLSPCFYGMKKTDDTQGCIQIWEHPTIGPDGRPPFGLYIAGTDPYDQDKAPNSVSLGSTIIYKTFSTDGGTYEWPVAEYTARPGTAKEHHETVKRLLLYYNARCLYENERNTIKMHFEQTNSLYLLAKTPTILKATQNTKVDRTYGIHMTDVIKAELEIYLRDWLITPTGDGQMNLHKIYSIPILEELVNYNEKGNFDRIIALLLVILKRLQDFRIKVESVKEESKVVDSFFTRQFFR